MTVANAVAPPDWELRTTTLVPADHTLVMGVLNVTPDSFSDGGRFVAGGGVDTASALAAGLTMWRRGADIVDIGGESTRPGSDGVDAADEVERVVPVIAGLAAEGVIVSVDTTKPDVAEAALAAGAEIVNDITGLTDPAMVDLCARTGAGVVVMHMQGTPRTMQQDPRYDDVVEEVAGYLEGRAAAATAAGVDPRRICLDPGIGFGKTFDHNLALLAGLRRITAGTYPVLVGTSRKGFLGEVLDRAGHPVPPPGRDAATAATTALAIAAGAAVVRVHDVAAGLQSARTADAIVAAAGGRTVREPASITER